MRARIFAAATSCLAEKGYHGLTLTQVVHGASVSTGAVQHHFRAKVDLMAGVADYLLNRSISWFARARRDVDATGGDFNVALQRSWREQFSTDEYAALIEILVAARTDEALARRVRPTLIAWRDAIDRELSDNFSHTDDKREAALIVTLSRALMTGFILHEGLIGSSPDKALGFWAEIVMARKDTER